ncbi:hypothetical protein [Devosia naphthalenivorans]|uniref:hypothetical protein n=1 Tax=Devosia naphthalenivorans TaxID=2082392 RepID=UPI000D3CC5A8|nr:hypothetical protein [Devosia naphthalenivorans]
MTPEEACEIDRLEFEADCRAARERAFALIAERHGAERARVLRWINDERPPPTVRFNPKPTPARSEPALPIAKPKRERLLSGKPQYARGMSMTLREWADFLGISLNTLSQRMHKTRSLEAAIAIGDLKPTGRRKAGVVPNLPALEGTGGGSTAQDFSEIEFSQ